MVSSTLPFVSSTAPVPSGTSANIIPSDCLFIQAPSQTAVGTTSECCQWYTPVFPDICYSIETALGVDLGAIEILNPEVSIDCTNLIQGISQALPILELKVKLIPPDTVCEEILHHHPRFLHPLLHPPHRHRLLTQPPRLHSISKQQI